LVIRSVGRSVERSAGWSVGQPVSWSVATAAAAHSVAQLPPLTPHCRQAGRRGCQAGRCCCAAAGILNVEGGAHAVVRDALAKYLLGNAVMATAASRGGEERGNSRDGDGSTLAEGILATVQHGNDSRRWPIGVRDER
jgi:hypothetical protein